MLLCEFFVPVVENSRTRAQEIVSLVSSPPGNWQIQTTNNFNRSFKKYKKDDRVLQGILDLLQYIVSNNNVPHPRNYPIQLNVHQIKQGIAEPYRNSLWAHLKGQKIGILFRVENNTVTLLNLGTHQDFGWR